ncbi:MAG: hypothetical protein FWD86_03800 [Firmicutes bacterium]|nr:hypothetical protein [Bacillota bacterium]
MKIKEEGNEEFLDETEGKSRAISIVRAALSLTVGFVAFSLAAFATAFLFISELTGRTNPHFILYIIFAISSAAIGLIGIAIPVDSYRKTKLKITPIGLILNILSFLPLAALLIWLLLMTIINGFVISST